MAAKQAGLTCTVLDRGCITESLTHYPYYMTFFSTAERLEIGGVPFTIPDAKPTRREALAYYRHVVTHHGLNVRQYEEVTRVVRHNEEKMADKSGWDSVVRHNDAEMADKSGGGVREPMRAAFTVHTRSREGRAGRMDARDAQGGRDAQDARNAPTARTAWRRAPS